MVSWADAHRNGLVTALRVHRDLGSNLSERVPVFEIADRLDLVTRFGPLPRLAGAYVRETGAEPGMLVNTRHPLAKQRYTAAHEIGHHVFGHASTLDLDTDLGLSSGGISDHEREAEAFAAWFLMPRQLVRGLLDGRTVFGPEDIYQLSLRMGTSYEATCRHLVNLGVLTAMQRDRLLVVSPKVVKVSLAGSPPIGVGRGDVHVVGAADVGTRLHVSPKDLLVVRADCSLPTRFEVDAGQLATAEGGPVSNLHGVALRLRVVDLATEDPGTVSPSFPVVVYVDDDQWSFTLVVEPPRKGVAERWFLS